MYNCINLIKLSILHNKKGFILEKNNKNLNILKPFIKLNIIKFIKIIDNNLIIYINYINNKPIFKNILNFLKKGNIKTISLKKLKIINYKYNWIFVLSTNKGLLNTYEAIEKKTGGIILFKIWN